MFIFFDYERHIQYCIDDECELFLDFTQDKKEGNRSETKTWYGHGQILFDCGFSRLNDVLFERNSIKFPLWLSTISGFYRKMYWKLVALIVLGQSCDSSFGTDLIYFHELSTRENGFSSAKYCPNSRNADVEYK